MRSEVLRRVAKLSMPAAFAAGVGVGWLWRGSERILTVDEPSRGAPQEVLTASAASETAEPAEVKPTASAEAVEVVSWSGEDAWPDVTEAHRRRRAVRAAARRMRGAWRRNFFAALDLDLFTEDQRTLHAEYCEAVATRDAMRAEADSLRAKGQDVPATLQRRLADAEAVIRADAAAEERTLRAAAARAAGLNERAVDQLIEDLEAIEGVLSQQDH